MPRVRRRNRKAKASLLPPNPDRLSNLGGCYQPSQSWKDSSHASEGHNDIPSGSIEPHALREIQTINQPSGRSLTPFSKPEPALVQMQNSMRTMEQKLNKFQQEITILREEMKCIGTFQSHEQGAIHDPSYNIRREDALYGVACPDLPHKLSNRLKCGSPKNASPFITHSVVSRSGCRTRMIAAWLNQRWSPEVLGSMFSGSDQPYHFEHDTQAIAPTLYPDVKLLSEQVAELSVETTEDSASKDGKSEKSEEPGLGHSPLRSGQEEPEKPDES